jgi:hypothetical protein
MIRRLLLVVALALAFVASAALPVGAQEVPGEAPVVEVVKTISLNATIVFLAVNFLLPVFNGIILKANPRPLVAQILSALTAAVAGFITAATQTDGSAIFTPQAVLFAVVAFLIQVASYVGVWKPHNVNAATGRGLVG